MKTIKAKTATLPTGLPMKWYFAVAAIALALFAMPHLGHAQGIVRGAQEGVYQGSRAAGPVGGVVGGVKGVLGIPDRGYRRGYRCRGFYDRRNRFHCYR